MANRINPRFEAQNLIDDLLELVKSLNLETPRPRQTTLGKTTGVAKPKRRFTPAESRLAQARQLFTGDTSPSSVVKGGNRSHVNFNKAVSEAGHREQLEKALNKIMSPEKRKAFLRQWEEAIGFHVPDGTY